MKRLACTVLAVLALVSGSAQAQEKVGLILDWLPTGEKSPAYIAASKGFFAEQGLDVTIQNARGTTEALVRVAAGAGDFATGALNALLQASAESDIPISAVMSVYTKQPDALFAIKGGPIKSLKDVAGRKVATSTFTSSNTVWPVILMENGIDPESVKLTKTDPTALAPMLASGQVDATISWMTLGPKFQGVLKQAGKDLTILPWADIGLDGYGWSMFASNKIIAERPQLVAGFVRAMRKSLDYCIAHPDEAGAAVHAKAPTLAAHEAAEDFQAAIPMIINEISQKDGIGALEASMVKKTWYWVAKAQNYPLDKIDPERAINRSFIR